MKFHIAFLACLACVHAATAQIVETPTSAWTAPDPEPFAAASPGDLDFDADALEAAAEFAEQIDSDALIVLRNGRIVLERYWHGKARGDVQQMYSATKSPFAYLVGRCIARGYIRSLDQAVFDLVPEARGSGRETLTFRSIMAMESGLEQSRELDRADAAERRSQLDAVLARSVVHEPNTWYHYNNAAYRLLFTALERASGKSLPELSQEELFGPLGMEGAYWVELQQGGAHMGYQSIRMRPVDMAKVGQIALDGGQWRGMEYLPKEFMESLFVAPNPDANPSYGLFFHLNAGEFFRSYYESERIEGRLVPDAPSDAVANYGHGGQVVVAIPSLSMVWVRTGPDTPNTIWERDNFVSQLSALLVAADTRAD